MGNIKVVSPFIELACSGSAAQGPIKLRADHVTSILLGSSGSDVWDISGQCHRTAESPDEVEEIVTQKLGLLGLVPPIVPMREDSE